HKFSSQFPYDSSQTTYNQGWDAPPSQAGTRVPGASCSHSSPLLSLSRRILLTLLSSLSRFASNKCALLHGPLVRQQCQSWTLCHTLMTVPHHSARKNSIAMMKLHDQKVIVPNLLGELHGTGNMGGESYSCYDGQEADFGRLSPPSDEIFSHVSLWGHNSYSNYNKVHFMSFTVNPQELTYSSWSLQTTRSNVGTERKPDGQMAVSICYGMNPTSKDTTAFVVSSTLEGRGSCETEGKFFKGIFHFRFKGLYNLLKVILVMNSASSALILELIFYLWWMGNQNILWVLVGVQLAHAFLRTTISLFQNCITCKDSQKSIFQSTIIALEECIWGPSTVL
ncbi:hypothetical protein STEG23_008948, partial [Scotinomys teguina]